MKKRNSSDQKTIQKIREVNAERKKTGKDTKLQIHAWNGNTIHDREWLQMDNTT